ncbi:unnamed protein product [Oncorhynchus mykiss]|uniref:Heparan-sulfate 6-O-sulfotransferase n=1 Tax=Oncorhynchus mykiss TaxID=8022 RepID=A0A060WPH0_ONCMY|nr:unnamed protein product [Oncorhynchus mykiss]
MIFSSFFSSPNFHLFLSLSHGQIIIAHCHPLAHQRVLHRGRESERRVPVSLSLTLPLLPLPSSVITDWRARRKGDKERRHGKEGSIKTNVFFCLCCCRNFYYITMLRDPVSRYLSEWKHVQRGATWKSALHMCDGRSPTQDELPACYSGDDWTGVTLSNFMDCPSNLANNRQVRMLADLSLVGCYNVSTIGAERERGRVLLASAKNNLRNMAFYGLTEFQRKTQYLFERTFGLRFIQAFTQINSTRAASVGVGEGALRRRIEGLNALDVELYEYAKELFLRRYQYSRQTQHREQRLRRRQERQEERQEIEGVEGEEVGGVATTEDYSSQVVRW